MTYVIIGELTSDVVGVFIPIVAIVMALGTGMLKIWLEYKKRKEMFALFHQERMAAIEKGIEPPPLPDNFFREPIQLHANGRYPRRSGHPALLFGLVMLFIGLTLYPAIHFTVAHTDGGGDPAMFGLIPAGIGVAYLIYYFAVGRKIAAAMEEERKARLAAEAQVAMQQKEQSPNA